MQRSGLWEAAEEPASLEEGLQTGAATARRPRVGQIPRETRRERKVVVVGTRETSPSELGASASAAVHWCVTLMLPRFRVVIKPAMSMFWLPGTL